MVVLACNCPSRDGPADCKRLGLQRAVTRRPRPESSMIVNELQFGELHDFLGPILRLESRNAISRAWKTTLRMPIGTTRGIVGMPFTVPEHDRVLLRYKGYVLDILHSQWFDTKGMAVHLHFHDQKEMVARDLQRPKRRLN